MFTLIIPYHNRASYLPRLLDSIERCTICPTQIILVDNASTDDSAAYCQSFAQRHPELPIVLVSESRRGASFARNAGLAKVTTEWVYFFDSDDELSPDYFSEVQNFLRVHPDLDLVASATTMVFADGTEVARKVMGTASAADQILSSQLATQGMFLRTAFLREVGGWNESLLLWDDWELAFRLLHRGARTAWLPGRAWHRIYQHGDSITGTDFTSRHEQILRALAAVSQSFTSTDISLALALSFRQVLIAGKLYHEGSHALSKFYYHQALKGQSHAESSSVTPTASLSGWHPSFLASLLLRCLYRYTRWGGRGGWYLAIRLTHWLA